MSEKIKPQHLARKAMLYVRQSSTYQVNHNLESQRLQYAMQDRLRQLGWRDIEVVDEDLGRSAAGTVRPFRWVYGSRPGSVSCIACTEPSGCTWRAASWNSCTEEPIKVNSREIGWPNVALPPCWL